MVQILINFYNIPIIQSGMCPMKTFRIMPLHGFVMVFKWYVCRALVLYATTNQLISYLFFCPIDARFHLSIAVLCPHHYP